MMILIYLFAILKMFQSMAVCDEKTLIMELK